MESDAINSTPPPANLQSQQLYSETQKANMLSQKMSYTLALSLNSYHLEYSRLIVEKWWDFQSPINIFLTKFYTQKTLFSKDNSLIIQAKT